MSRGFVVALLAVYAVVPRENWALPGAGFFAILVVGVLAASSVTLITWPLMGAATSHDSVRFE